MSKWMKATRVVSLGRRLRRNLFGDTGKGDERAGRYLETPQRWGILPTMAFWGRRDVGRSAALFLLPVWMLTANLGARIAYEVAWWAAPLVMAGVLAAMAFIQGLLERYIRRRAARMTALERSEHVTSIPDQEGHVVVTPRRQVILMFAMVLAATGLMSWAAGIADRDREARAQAREQREQRLRKQEQQSRDRRTKEWWDATGYRGRTSEPKQRPPE